MLGIAPSPDHDLKYQGGKTIQHLRFMNFYVGGDAWNSGDIANVDKGLAAAMSDRNLNNVMVQYFPGPITTNFDGSQTLPGPAPQVISQGDVEQIVTTFTAQCMSWAPTRFITRSASIRKRKPTAR